MRIVAISDTHQLHNRIEDLPAGDFLVYAGDFMNSGYDPQDVCSFIMAWRTVMLHRTKAKLAPVMRVFRGGSPDRLSKAKLSF